MISNKQKTKEEPPCDQCNAKCCRYIALEIDKPTCKRDYDHIRWYLLHKDVNVFVDHDGCWYIEFCADCERLGDANECLYYGDRPRICREHGEGEIDCEFDDDAEIHLESFSTVRQFEAYLRRRGVDWRWKHPQYRQTGSGSDRRAE